MCKLSFYLKCCIVGCDMHTLPVDEALLDYSNAHRLPSCQQYMILMLAILEFGLSRLINRAIFLDDEHKLLPAAISNAFYAIETTILHFPIDTASGDQVQVRKAMLCTTEWINEIYVKSIMTLHISFVNIPALIPSLEGSFHCIHCLGLPGECMCLVGCPNSRFSQCLTVHRGVSCSECKARDIVGSKFRCLQCTDCNLCETCYQEHDQLHEFERTTKPNTPAEHLGFRALPLSGVDDRLCVNHDIPTAVAVPIETAVACSLATTTTTINSLTDQQ